MTYSRKGRLLFRGALFAVVAAWVAFVLLLRPSRSFVPYASTAVMIVCLGLAVRAFMYLDEIERARRMRACFYGAMFGTFAAAIALAWLTVQPAMLDALADLFHHRSPHQPFEYFALGVLMTLIAQIACTLLTSLAMRLKSGA